MTEKPSDTAQTDPIVEPADVPSTASESTDVVRTPSSKKPWLALFGVALLVAAVVAALWYQRQALDLLNQALVSRIDNVAASVDTAKRDADQALALARAQAATIQDLQTSLAEVRTQYQALQESWSHPSHEADEAVLLNDVEQLLTQAHQQLRLGGNVGNAIIALDIAQTRLARFERPEWLALQQTIDADLTNLRATPMVDVPVLAARINQLIDLVGRAPMLAPDAAASTSAEAVPAMAHEPSIPSAASLPEDATWWQQLRGEVATWPDRALHSLSREMSAIISIRRVEDANVLLLAPEQAEQLRATLRMRLLTAQVALLMHQPIVWQSELAIVSSTLASNYDARSVDTMTAVQIARELLDVNVAVTLPDLSDSLKAIATLRTTGDLASADKE